MSLPTLRTCILYSTWFSYSPTPLRDLILDISYLGAMSDIPYCDSHFFDAWVGEDSPNANNALYRQTRSLAPIPESERETPFDNEADRQPTLNHDVAPYYNLAIQQDPESLAPPEHPYETAKSSSNHLLRDESIFDLDRILSNFPDIPYHSDSDPLDDRWAFGVDLSLIKSYNEATDNSCAQDTSSVALPSSPPLLLWDYNEITNLPNVVEPDPFIISDAADLSYFDRYDRPSSLVPAQVFDSGNATAGSDYLSRTPHAGEVTFAVAPQTPCTQAVQITQRPRGNRKEK